MIQRMLTSLIQKLNNWVSKYIKAYILRGGRANYYVISTWGSQPEHFNLLQRGGRGVKIRQNPTTWYVNGPLIIWFVNVSSFRTVSNLGRILSYIFDLRSKSLFRWYSTGCVNNVNVFMWKNVRVRESRALGSQSWGGVTLNTLRFHLNTVFM